MTTALPSLTRLGKKGTFLPNLITSLLGFVISLLVGIWYTPFLIRQLGTTSFGLVPLATTATSYLGLLTIAFSHSLARFFTIAVERDDRDDANRIFNTALWGAAGLSVLIVLPASIFSLAFNSIAHVPTGAEQDVVLLFTFATTAFIVDLITAPYNIATFARNRLDLRNAGEALTNVVRVLTVLLLFAFLAPRLWHVGVGLLVASLLRALYSIFTTAHLVPYLTFSRHYARWDTFKAMYHTSTWVIVDQLGLILCGGLDVLLANVLIGAQAAGEYALVLQWSSLLRALGTSCTSVLAPSAISHFARNNIEALIASTRSGIRLTAICLALPIGLICGLSREILSLWIGVPFETLAPLMQLSLAPLVLFLAATPLIYVLMALNAVKLPALFTVGLGTINVILIYFFSGWLTWGLYGIATATLITQCCKYLLFLPIYTSLQTSSSLRRLICAPWRGAVATIAVASLAYCAARLYHIGAVLDLVWISVPVGLLYSVTAYAFLLNREDRHLLRSRVTAVLTRYRS